MPFTMGQILGSRYRIIEILGTGGMGQTYLAEDTRRPGNPQCVVKQLKPASTDPKFLVTAKRLFENEAVILEKLGRANDQIPQLLERFEKDGEFYLVQDFVDGEPLSSEMPLGQRWSEAQVIQLLLEVLPILDTVHKAGIIHRDVKPDNLIRRKDGKLCLIDFGAVKQIRTYQPTHSQLISSTVAIGTSGYLPVEQAKGKPRPNSDLYALGLVAVQALTGMLPSQLREDDAGEVIWRDQAEVSDGLAKLLSKMVCYHFKDRYQTASEALQALQAISPIHQVKSFNQKLASETSLVSSERYQLEQLLSQSKPGTFSWTNNLVATDELPLLYLFTCLQEAGLPLGIDEYFLVLRALQKSFGTANQEALADLCRTLWVKSKDEEHLFNYHFEQVMRTVPASSIYSPTKAAPEPSTSSPTSTERREVQDVETDGEESSAFPTTSTSISQELMEVEDEIQVAEAVQIATRSDREVVINRFSQSDEYFPVTRRQMKQSWRYLRRMVREGSPVEIDIEATIDRFSQQGIPSDPVLVPARINRTELLLLIDHKGSMVPFHALSQRLAETAQRGGRLGEAGIFYFHNCPTQYLYRDPSRQQAEFIPNLLMKLHPERSVVLIFSDGGAARGGFNPERVKLTNQFLDQIKERVRYVTWLNPMSKERWAGTTAGEIAQRVSMFEMSRKGMDGAIDVLRGRSLQIIG